MKHHDSVSGCRAGQGARAEATAVAQQILQQLPADEFPHLADMIIEHALQPDYDYAAEFDFGLDLILDGLERIPRPQPTTRE